MIYFIRQEYDSLVKIGHTHDIKHRLSALQVSNGHKLEVILLIRGMFKEEQEIHDLFSDDKFRGEWYYFSDDIKNYIKSQYDNDIRLPEKLYSEMDEAIQTRFIRKSAKLTLRDVGLRLGMTPQSVREIEMRELMGNITIKGLNKYGKALGYRLVYKFAKVP